MGRPKGRSPMFQSWLRLSSRLLPASILLALLTACSPATTPGGTSAPGSAPAAQTAPKKTTATLGVSAVIDAFSYAQSGTTAGGGFSFYELWLQGLVTSGTNNTAPEARIAVQVPSLDNGGAVITPDGKMRVTWKIRPDVRWADNTDLTAKDYAFGFEVVKSPDNPMVGVAQISAMYQLVESVEAPDDDTIVMSWTRPFYQFNTMGFALQPFPSHLLRPIWDARNLDAMANHAYWREEYFQVGPYRPVKFEPAVEIILESVPYYFLGKPKLDRIVIKQYGDANALFAALKAGAIDVTPENALRTENALELKDEWERTGEGKVYLKAGGSNGVFPQFKPEYQAEPAMFDPRVRQALMYAMDRESWTGAMLAGQTQNTSYSLLPPGDPLYESTKDSLRSYRFDLQQALRLMDEAGWVKQGDALVSKSDGRRMRIEIRGGNGGPANILQDQWKQIGVDAPQQVVSQAQLNDREIGQNYTGVEISARGYGDQLLTRAECATSSEPPRFSGLNRGHYCNRQMDELIGNYRSSLTPADQGRWMTEIARLHAQELPVLQTYFSINSPAVVKGINVLESDFEGALQPSGFYGSFFRNGHLWEWK
jgi:peptide/nickel transport system substrate-binding protein